MAISDLLRTLLPNGDELFSFVEQGAAQSWRAATALAALAQPGSRALAIRVEVGGLGATADSLRRRLDEALAATFVTPLDREDLQRLSTEIEAITDLTNSAAYACEWLGVEAPSAPMVRLMATLVEATSILKRAVPALREQRSDQLIDAGRALRSLEKEADTIYHLAVSELLRLDPFDAREVFREQEVLKSLASAVRHSANVGRFLTQLGLKNG